LKRKVANTPQDAPALDALTYYGLEEKNGGVYVTGEEKELKDNFPQTLSLKCEAHGEEKLVIVGGYVVAYYHSIIN
jgi:hypothetical protein